MSIGTLVDMGRDGFERKYHTGYIFTEQVKDALLAYFKRHGFDKVPGWGNSSQAAAATGVLEAVAHNDARHEKNNESADDSRPINATQQMPSLPTSRSLVFAADPIGVLMLDDECAEYLGQLGIKTIADLVRELGQGSKNPGAAFAPRLTASIALEQRAYAFSDPLSKEQLKVLVSLSGSEAFVFDLFGVLCDVDSICSKNGYSIDSALSSGLGEIPLSSLDLDPLLVKRLERKGATKVSDVLSLSEEEFAEKYQRSANSTRMVYSEIEKLKSDDGLAGFGESYDAFVSHYSRSAAMASRDVRNAFEGADYPVSEKELNVFAIPLATEVLRKGDGHSPSVREVARQLRSMAYVGKVAQATLTRRLRANVAALDSDKPYVTVTLPDDANWRYAAGALKREYRKGLICNTQDGTFDFRMDTIHLSEWLNSLPDNLGHLVNARVNGASLPSCASIFQTDAAQVKTLLQKVYSMRPLIIEERFLPMFETYEFTPAKFANITGQTVNVFRFLADVSTAPKSGKIPILHDADEQPESAQLSETLSESGNPAEDGIPEVDAESALEYVVKKYASDQPRLLVDLWQQYLKLAKKRFPAEEWTALEDLGKFYGKLLDADCAIVSVYSDDKSQMMVRYYDFSSADFGELSRLLAKQAGRNVECGFAYVLSHDADFKEECEELDLRNDVEVHFVASHYCNFASGVEIGEYPLVKLGEASSEFQLRQLIGEIGPVNVSALEKEYSQRYGVTGQLFFDKYLPRVIDLRRGNQYYPSNDQHVLSGEQQDFLREELENGGVCYSADLLKTRFEVRFPKSSVDVLSPEVLGSLGRKLSDGLVFDYNTNIREYFASLLQGKKRFSVKDPGFGEAVFRHQVFRSELERAKRQFDFVEVADDSYVATAPFMRLDSKVSRWDLQDYLNCAIDFMEPGVPYTVFSLRKAGFKHKVDCLEEELGFGQFFYESLLSMGYVNSRLKKTRVGNCKVFCRTEGSYSGSLLVEWVMEENPALELEELSGILAESFGIEVELSRLRSLVKRSDCYYQKELDMVFSSENEYGKKVQEWL